MESTLYEQMGGESKLRAVIDLFVERVFADVMIGFFFRKTSMPKLAALEFQHAAEFLGAPVVYEGRPLDKAHRAHKIQGGQFARRRQILKDVLEEMTVPEPVRVAWLAHQESLRGLITEAKADGCDMGPQ